MDGNTYDITFYANALQVKKISNKKKEDLINEAKRRGYNYHKINCSLGYFFYTNDIIILFINETYLNDKLIETPLKQILSFINYSLNTCHKLSYLQKIFCDLSKCNDTVTYSLYL